MTEVVLHSVHRDPEQKALQIHLDSPPSLAGPGSTEGQLNNPVGSFLKGAASLSPHTKLEDPQQPKREDVQFCVKV